MHINTFKHTEQIDVRLFVKSLLNVPRWIYIWSRYVLPDAGTGPAGWLVLCFSGAYRPKKRGQFLPHSNFLQRLLLECVYWKKKSTIHNQLTHSAVLSSVRLQVSEIIAVEVKQKDIPDSLMILSSATSQPLSWDINGEICKPFQPKKLHNKPW